MIAAGLHHIAVLVENLERAAAFYENVLGLPVLERHDGGARSIWLKAGEAILMLERAERGPRRGPQAPGWHLIALRIDAAERERVEAHLGAHGVDIVDRTDYTLYIEDPEGNRVGLSHYPVPAQTGERQP